MAEEIVDAAREDSPDPVEAGAKAQQQEQIEAEKMQQVIALRAGFCCGWVTPQVRHIYQ